MHAVPGDRLIIAAPSALWIQNSKFASSPKTVALLNDSRLQKRFESGFALALKLATELTLPVAFLGTCRMAAHLVAKSRAAEVRMDLLSRTYRAGFRAWRAQNASDFVSLSIIEGVPSTLPDALVAERRRYVHDLDSIHWRARCGIDASSELYSEARIVSFRLNSRSFGVYAANAIAMFDNLLTNLQTKILSNA
jgi:hypothetical protein